MVDFIEEVLPCDEACELPPGVRVSEVPRPRHKWNDVLVCPNCGRAWLIHKESMDMLRGNPTDAALEGK